MINAPFLSPEIVAKIVPLVEPTDLPNLRLACSWFQGQAENRLFRNMDMQDDGFAPYNVMQVMWHPTLKYCVESVEWHGKILSSLQVFGEQVAWDVIEVME